MSLWSTIRDLLGGGTALRNKPGGMAWVRGVPECLGAEQLNGAAVKTVRLNEIGAWEIEPHLHFIATEHKVLFGQAIVRGLPVHVRGIEDCYLEPWKDIGDEDRSEETTFQPKVPVLQEPGRVEA